MLSTKLLKNSINGYKILSSIRCYSNKTNPFVKTWNILSKDIQGFFGSKKATIYPEHADVVIIGGGILGSSIAYSLKARAAHGLSVVVLEKDLSYNAVQTKQSLGTIHQHFTLPENMHLSQYSADFLRNVKKHLNDGVDVKYFPNGNLVLASEKYAQKLEENVTLQKEFGIKNELLTPDAINKRYPWISTHDVKLGCLGLESEGVMNMWSLLNGYVEKSLELGATYVNAEVVGFEMEKQRDLLMEGVAPGTYKRITKVIYRTPDNEEISINFAICVLAAGSNSGDIAKLANVGTGDGLLSVPLPIEQREHDVYSIKFDSGLNSPCIIDSSGLWLKKNGFQNNFIGGHYPFISTYNENQMNNNDVQYNLIESTLPNRVPDCKTGDVKKLPNEIYDCNTYDDTGIVGPHPYHNNLFIASGFGKLGYQHSPGIGRAITELIVDSQYVTIDLSRFSFDRILTRNPMVEFNIY